MDKFRALSYFVETAENGSFSATAKRFKVPASSISRRISDLESDLGAQLLTRSTRSVALTEVGEQYLKQVKGILEQVSQSDQMVKSYQAAPTGVLKISAMVGFGESILLPILDEFSDLYPEITLDVVLSDQLSKLEKDDVDIAIRGGYAPDERVVAVRLMDNDFVVAASQAYLATHGSPCASLELKHHQGLFFKTPVGPTPWLTEINGEWLDVSGNPKLVTNNGEWLLQKAIQGQGILMLPRWVLQPVFDSGDLVELTFDDPVQVSVGRDLAIFLLYQKLEYSIPKIKAAVDFITEKVRGF
ncbi:LysR family transcriptional regulator [Vibrio nigripulchritudo]|uniref:LysR family transcriptional regulator n=1 Tax=Vibrio nigripulchritudo TaxID=28173 RepID=UPI0005FA213F|nr:LysR family transcriptional regulator [Vibrio nigripulchritudo]KJY74706.1 LysR family transcriptional regulator [Vibrio nigripulchritudo]